MSGFTKMRLFLNLAWSSTPFFLLVGPFPRLLQNPFEKQQVAACRFSKEFCANPRNVSTKEETGIMLCCLQKSLTKWKGFGVKQPITFLFNIIILCCMLGRGL
jgi:hypothetical protein